MLKRILALVWLLSILKMHMHVYIALAAASTKWPVHLQFANH